MRECRQFQIRRVEFVGERAFLVARISAGKAEGLYCLSEI